LVAQLRTISRDLSLLLGVCFVAGTLGLALASANVSLAADGTTIAQSVTGSGVDMATVNPTLSTTSPALTLAGTATDNVGVTRVTWANG